MTRVHAEIHVGATEMLCISDDLASSGGTERIAWADKMLGLHLRLIRARFLQGSGMVAVVVHLSEDLGLCATGPENATLVRTPMRSDASPVEVPVTELRELAEFLARHGFLTVSMTVPALDGTGPVPMQYGEPDQSKPWAPVPSMIADRAHGGKVLPLLLAQELRRGRTVRTASPSPTLNKTGAERGPASRGRRNAGRRSGLPMITGLLAFAVVTAGLAVSLRSPSLIDDLIPGDARNPFEPTAVAAMVAVGGQPLSRDEGRQGQGALAGAGAPTRTVPATQGPLDDGPPVVMADVPRIFSDPNVDAGVAEISDAGLILPVFDRTTEARALVTPPVRVFMPRADAPLPATAMTADPPPPPAPLQSVVATAPQGIAAAARPVPRPQSEAVAGASPAGVAEVLAVSAQTSDLSPPEPLPSQPSSSDVVSSARALETGPTQRPVSPDAATPSVDPTPAADQSVAMANDPLSPPVLEQPQAVGEREQPLARPETRPMLRPARVAAASAAVTRTPAVASAQANRPVVASAAPNRPTVAAAPPNRTAVADPAAISDLGTTATGAMVEVSLLAIYGTDNDLRAVVGLPSGETVSLGRGNLLLGWTVTNIRRDGMTLASRGSRLNLFFRE